MNGLQQSAVLVAALVGLAACGSAGGGFKNLLDGNEYRVLAVWPLLCHPDGSVILVQKVNPAGGFTEATETAQPCAPIVLETDVRRFTPNEAPSVEAPAPEAPDGFFGDAGLL